MKNDDVKVQTQVETDDTPPPTKGGMKIKSARRSGEAVIWGD